MRSKRGLSGLINRNKKLSLDGLKNMRKKSWDFKKRGKGDKEKLEQDERMEQKRKKLRGRWRH